MATVTVKQQQSAQSEPNFIFHGDKYDPNLIRDEAQGCADDGEEEQEQEQEQRGRGGGRWQQRTSVQNLSYYLPLYQAARDGDWKKGKEFIDRDRGALTAIISVQGGTALHIAASCGRSEFVEEMVKLMPTSALELQDIDGCTPLHCIAVRGTVKSAMVLVEKNPYLTEIVNYNNNTPLYHLCATKPLISSTQREMVWYLCWVTIDVYPSFCFSGGGAPSLIVKLLASGHLDICLHLFRRYPRLAKAAIVERGDELIIGLCAAASEFPSGNTLGIFESCLYKIVPSVFIYGKEPMPINIKNLPPPCIPVDIRFDSERVGQVPFAMQPTSFSRRVFPSELIHQQAQVPGDIENPPSPVINSDSKHVGQVPSLVQLRTSLTRAIQWLTKVLSTASIKQITVQRICTTAIKQIIGVPYIKKFIDMKRRHYHSLELLHHICQLVTQQQTMDLLSLFREKYVLHTATERGIVEMVAVFLRYFPDMILQTKDDSNETLLHVAVENRREKIFNLLMELGTTMSTSCVFMKLESGENIMHLAAKLAPSLQLNSVSGPALQMQRELQWFKEVEKLFNNTDKRLKDKDGKTPRELFTKEHRELKEKGEQWMRDTSNSCVVVTTLIATIAFAAAFTVPGGNDSQNGTPIFLYKGSFMVFAISDVLALFSSVTSLIMFLAILTSRYAEEDFLISLPRKLIIGLSSLFVAIATMMIAFGAGLSIVLGARLEWIYILVILLVCFPVALFGMLQLPLLVQMIRSTYGRGIFYRPGDY